MANRTYQYIMQHLDPFVWNKNPDWESVRNTCGVDEDEVAEMIDELPYWQFLQTSYWKAIRGEVLRRAGQQCEVCGNTEGLDAHHSTYKHHGREHRHLQDLKCLCHRCHQKEHDTVR